jgi:hypothetical protein
MNFITAVVDYEFKIKVFHKMRSACTKYSFRALFPIHMHAPRTDIEIILLN